MTVKITEYTEPRANKVLTGMFLHSQVLGKISSQWDQGARFGSSGYDILGQIAVDYFRSYGKAPRKHVPTLVRGWGENNPHRKEDFQTIEFICSTLPQDIERERKELNPQYILDLAGEMFNKIAFRRLLDQAEGDLSQGHVRKAMQRVTEFRAVDMGQESTGRLLNDPTELEYAFLEDNETLIEYPGALGQFFQNTLAKDSLVAFMGAEKMGKTFWLLDVAFRAVEQRRKTVFFEVGDMSKQQIYRRFLCRLTKQIFRSPTGKWPCTILYPTSLESPPAKDEPAIVSHEERVLERPLSYKAASEAVEHFRSHRLRSLEDYLRIRVHPNNSVNVTDIKSELQKMDQEGFTADVVVIDYADILAPPAGTGRFDARDQINRTWQQLRSLSTQRSCLVVTATQANAKSYDQRGLLGRWNFSEDKRKLAAVTALAGINATPDEKDAGLMKLNWIALREAEFNSRKAVHVASCLPLASPAVLSTW